MIKKCIKIKNVGRFVNHAAQGQQDFQDITLIYAPNGNGKTTLADIIRSLMLRDSSLIEARHTAGKQNPAKVSILTENGIAQYENAEWTGDLIEGLQVEIFDTTFIHENIFAGDLVAHHQKVNQFQFMVGQRGVNLSNQEQEINEQLSDAKKHSKNVEARIKAYIKSNIKINKFLHISQIDDVDSRIQQQKKLVKRLKTAKKINNKRKLKKLELPALPIEDFQDLLGMSLDDVSSDAEDRVKKHLNCNLEAEGVTWIGKGLSFVGDDEDPCPFCGRSLSGVDLIEAYKSFFNQSYQELKENIQDFGVRTNNLLGQRALSQFQEAESENGRRMEFWDSHIKKEYQKLNFSHVREVWISTRQALALKLKSKSAQPLQPISFDDEVKIHIEKYQAAEDLVRQYNKRVEELNRSIQEVKSSTSNSALGEETEKLRRLLDQKARHEDEEVASTCAEYSKLNSQINEFSKKLKKVRQDSKAHAKSVFKNYRASINGHLKNIGAQFKIGEMRVNRQGHRPRNEYPIIINDQEIKLGSEETPSDKPRFKTALSTGDKHTLAFAFFLSRMDEKDLSDSIVVFDDPVTSMDIHREEYACQEILKVTKEAKQVIVLSHRPELLHLLDTDDRNYFDTQLIQIERIQSKSSIKPWDKTKFLRDDFRKDYDTLIDFRDGKLNNILTTLRAIRPLLERSLEHKYPNHLYEQEGLGDHVARIREAKEDSPLSNMKQVLEDIDSLHQFTKDYHHGRRSGQKPSRAQLEAKVDKALEIVHR